MVRRLAVVAVALAFGLVGCSGGTDSGKAGTSTPAATTGGGSDAVAWADKVCGAVGPELEGLGKTPEIDSSDPQKAKDGMLAYLDKVSGAFGKMISGMKDAGDPPVTNGKQLVDNVTKALDEVKSTVDTAKDNLSKVDASDPQKFQAGFQQVGTDLQKVGDMEDPTKGLRGDKELEDAFKNAPKCKALESKTGGPSTGNSSAPTS